MGHLRVQAMGTPIVTTPAVSGENGPIPAVSNPPAAPFDALMALLTPATPATEGAAADGALPVADPTIVAAPGATAATLVPGQSLQAPVGGVQGSVSKPMVNAAASTPDADLVDMLAMSASASRRVVARAPVAPQPAAPLVVQPEDFIGPVRPNELTAEPAALMTTVSALPEAAMVPEDFIGPILPAERRQSAAGEALPPVADLIPPLPHPELLEQVDASGVPVVALSADNQLSAPEGLLQPFSVLADTTQPAPDDMIAQPIAINAPQDQWLSPIDQNDAQRTMMASAQVNVVQKDGLNKGHGDAKAMSAHLDRVLQQGAAASGAHDASTNTLATSVVAGATTESVGETEDDLPATDAMAADHTNIINGSTIQLDPIDAAALVALAQQVVPRVETTADQSRPDMLSGDPNSRVLIPQAAPQQAQANASAERHHPNTNDAALQSVANREAAFAQANHSAMRGKQTDIRGVERQETTDALLTNDLDALEDISSVNRNAAHARVIQRQGVMSSGHAPRDMIADALSDHSAKEQPSTSARAFEIDAKVAAMVQSIAVTGDANSTSIVAAAQAIEASPLTRTEAVARDSTVVSAVAAEGRRDTQRDAEIRERQIKQQVTMALRAGGQEVRMQLYPPGLGQVMIRIALDGTKLRLSMKADNAEASEALMQAEGGLRDALSRDGFNLAGFDVHDDEHKKKREQAQAQPISTTNTGSGEAFSVDMTA